MKAVETKYDGHRFRSRLEARWAVFFNTLGIAYQYEPEGFDLGENYGWYLPDFYLPDQGYYIEIKGDRPTEKEQTKVYILYEQVRKLRKDVYLFWGDVAHPSKANFSETDEAIDKATRYGITTFPTACGIYSVSAGGDPGYCWIECPFCYSYHISQWGSLMCIGHECKKSPLSMELTPESTFKSPLTHYLLEAPCMEDYGLTQESIMAAFCLDPSPRLLAAHEAARSARFEHGEHP